MLPPPPPPPSTRSSASSSGRTPSVLDTRKRERRAWQLRPAGKHYSASICGVVSPPTSPPPLPPLSSGLARCVGQPSGIRRLVCRAIHPTVAPSPDQATSRGSTPQALGFPSPWWLPNARGSPPPVPRRAPSLDAGGLGRRAPFRSCQADPAKKKSRGIPLSDKRAGRA